MLTLTPENRSRGGVAIVLILVLFLLAAGGAAFYFYTESSKESYAAETIQMASDLSKAVIRLDENATAGEIQRVRNQISEYLARTDAIPSARETWIAHIETIESKREERMAKVEELNKRVAEFPLSSSAQELEAFETELKALSRNLDTETRNELLSTWSQRKQRILTEINSVSATVIAKSFPSGAKTYLDGEYIGLSSLGIQNVRKGTHLLRFEKEGYLPAEIEVEVTRSGQIEPPAVDLQMATNPVSVKVVGGKMKAEISVSIEKTADNNKDIILYIEEQKGREATFDQAPTGTILLSVTSDLRLAHEQVIINQPGDDQVIEVVLEK
ncbi:PEGA domain-containing protein [Pelagicoccus sp. SDUM812003]|uniref:PEGA domain-containing protein n=1 Tax=Pelagicoccus sp. SDUM812003 TaxID=3041267 RepID=UPI00280CB3F7|nr:PEGA domain-containing protein [Pelagicoccus sp. SDUM812003]MDQ8203567.1 PEGA domain-containing protein [Pelagicoccus sp. SDUM812003]